MLSSFREHKRIADERKRKEHITMEIFIRKPNIDLFPGIRVNKDTDFEYKNEKVTQSIKNLKLHTVANIKGEDYESTYDTTIYLEEGDILVFEEEGRGYIKPVESFVTISEAIEDLENIKGVGEND